MYSTKSLVLGFIALCAAVLIALPGFANYTYDGDWAVKVYTYSGACKSQYSFTLTIDNGDISGKVRGNQGQYLLKGAVDAQGAAEIDLIGPEAGKFIADFSDKKAKGSWTSQNCSGTFKFKKKKA